MPHNKIHIVNNFISQQDCDLIINYIDIKKESGQLEKRGEFKQRSMRSEADHLGDILKKYGLMSVDKSQDYFNKNSLLLSDYGIFISNAGYSMNYHIDTINSNEKFKHLEYTTVVYLNDNFSGGELYFPNIDFTYTPKKYDAVFFPANDLVYTHGVKEIKNGSRYTMAFWQSSDANEEVFFGGANGAIVN